MRLSKTVWLLAAGLLTGCEQESREALQSTPIEPAAVLVTVEGTPITREQLELAVERTLGDTAPLYATEEVERKILESLVSSRAMALLAERELSAGERAELELKAQAYREEILVKHYLQAHASPTPVTTEMVADYYARNPEEFGGSLEKTFEVIASARALDGDEKAELIELLSAAEVKEKDWSALVEQWRAQGRPLEYRQNHLKLELLDQPMRSLVAPTQPGDIAPLYTGEQLLLVRVTAERRLPAKPLGEVSADIREKLAPQALKQAIKSLSAEALKDVKVEYRTD